MVFLARMPIEDVEADKAERAMEIMVDTSLETLFSLSSSFRLLSQA